MWTPNKKKPTQITLLSPESLGETNEIYIKAINDNNTKKTPKILILHFAYFQTFQILNSKI